MCGIAGYVGDRESADVLVDALSKLEYRGYDSAGIAVFDHVNIKLKCKGRLANLVEKMDEEGKPQGHVELAIQDGLRMENHQTLIHIHMAIRELLLYITV